MQKAAKARFILSAALADCKKQRQEMCCVHKGTISVQPFSLFSRLFYTPCPAGFWLWCLSRAAGCFTRALFLPDRDNPCAGMLGQWQWLQMDAVSPSEWSGPTRYDLPVLSVTSLWGDLEHITSSPITVLPFHIKYLVAKVLLSCTK